jgi:formamidopyrimidine-DNA glycosylase
LYRRAADELVKTMPELPEVETVVRGLREPLLGRTLKTALFPQEPGRMTNMDPALLSARISGQVVQSVTRRAKYIMVQLDRDILFVHLKMTGRLYVQSAAEGDSTDRYLRVCFPLDNDSTLCFSDPRKFGRVFLAGSPAEVLPDLGPEPLDKAFTFKVFSERLGSRSGRIKSLLLDQSFVAGVGNIYADEALHIARIHPLRPANTLNKAEAKRLYNAIRQALSDGIRNQGASINWYRKADGSKGEQQEHLRVYHDPRQEKDKRCPVCGTPIQTIRVGQRGTHFCPTCQKL